MNFDNLTLHDVEILNDVAVEGSIRKVAIKRNIAQPALSRKIQILEECLGSPLFLRTRKGVETTMFGMHCLELLSKWRAEGLAASRKISQSIGNQITVRLGTYDSIAIYFFPQLLQLTHVEKLNCQIELHLNRSRQIIQDVTEGKIDIGLVFCGGLKPLSLSITRIGTDEYGFYEATHGRSGQDMISLETSEDDDGNSIEEYMKGLRFQYDRLIRCPSFEIAASLTIAGLGIGVLPHRVAQTHIKQNKLRQIEVAGMKSFGRHTLSVVRSKANRDPMIQKLIKLIGTGFANY